MNLSDFDYALPKELIAQYPSEKRGDDRLLVIDRGTARSASTVAERKFSDIAEYFKKGDLLVLNDTRVMPARLYGRRKTGGKVEIFIIDKTKVPVEALLRPSGRIDDGEEITLTSGDPVIIRGRTPLGRLVEFNDDVNAVMERAGHVPLPPYINRSDETGDRDRYQTVFAKCEGATASPTAGLHFTEGMLKALSEKGVEIAYVTLHVSYGTFAPVKDECLERHTMHSEYYRISKENVIMLNNARNEKRRIIACGTTSLRVLETCADELVGFIPQGYCYGGNEFAGFEGFTSLFVYPGYAFRIVNGLITNFHMPKSTLLLLTSAFAGKEELFRAYRYAIENKFRFFSYGDAMLIL
ncbi:MAG: tRNA preQ1(34) S-adenosylmethionine ribosyltransferase-isomerase QueA [Candidatus Omnitrophica bacterium]|nr:tRNA preQ1(34) S-adenosylmethionine ribosyltransferase-isomerase QueA [Candidatus Omnitrophota bacterium]